MEQINEGAGFNTTAQMRLAMSVAEDGKGAVALHRITDPADFKRDTQISLPENSVILAYFACEDTTVFLLDAGKEQTQALSDPQNFVDQKLAEWNETTLEGKIESA